MCGGGSGTTQTDVTQTNYNLPEWAQPYWEDTMARAAYDSTQPYQPYQGERLAYFSPMEQEAMTRYGELGVAGSPDELNAAGQAAYGLSFGWNPGIGDQFDPGYTAGTRQSGYAAGDYDQAMAGNNYDAGQRSSRYRARSLGAEGALDPYMDPYQQNVTDVAKREAARQMNQRQAQVGLQAAGSGSLGGYREAIMRGENERNLMQHMSDIQTKGSQDAYRNAQQAFEADRAARGQMEQFRQSQFGMNEQARQRAAELRQQGFSIGEAARQAQEQFGQSQYGLNQSALQQQGILGLQAQEAAQRGQIAAADNVLAQNQNQLAAAGLMGDIAGQQQDMEMERLAAMERAGMMERALMQQGLDIGYGDFLTQQGYPRETLQYFANLMYGAPIQPGAQTAVYGQQPSTTQQLLGSGIAGLGLYNALGGNTSGGAI